LARFSITARDQVDLENLAASMMNAVEESLQPERTSLWLQRSKR